ncbi:cupin [Bradyrhizobium sp. LTSPM299]|uniref:cupin domain-containing protein n=1 Tax=Bradyrhizobium sp. LTSPM299 TaxID=1619233 RepID=UPI0005CB2FFD|nr:cupin domain-containing protein [Bradyrhizobium sp. LTSPM299]KJC60319.1 cupin [Bradyrhizobium sp. LTSPM299]
MRKHLTWLAVSLVLVVNAAMAQESHPAKNAGASVTLDFAGMIPNLPGKSLKTVLVKYEPGISSPPHTHAKSAFILAYVLEGEVVIGVNGQPPRTYKAGEFWIENPGDHHGVSRNASNTNPARLLAIFVVDTNDTELTTYER